MFGSAGVVLTVAGVRRSRSAEQIVKPLVMSAIGIELWGSRDQRCPTDNALLGTALLAALVGDQLMLEEEFAVDERSAETWLKRAVAAFAASHVATSSLALRHGSRPGSAELLPRAVGLAEGVLLLAIRRRHMLGPLGGYSVLLALMSAVMAAPQLTDGTIGSDPRRALELGGMFFLASDATILHRQMFLGRESGAGAVAEGLVLGSYCAAQALIYGGLMKLSAAD